MVTGAGVGVGVALLARPLSLLSRRSLYLNSGASPSFPGGISSYRKKQNNSVGRRFFSAEALTNGETAPDLRRLAETARISLTQQEVEELGPKIQQVIGWFGQLQGVDLNRVEPGIRAATAAEAEEGVNLRDDVPSTFPKTDAIIEGIPSYEEPYLRVPKVLHKE
ncbi:Glutamyl-tRNA(Gln) amidotransferase subunit C, chloroplastic/mitochondrial [Linum grandiflorum]